MNLMSKENNTLTQKALRSIVSQYEHGQVFAYPTEAVFGLGCDPLNEKAVRSILALKERPEEKGLIVIASKVEQILPYVDLNQLPQGVHSKIMASWPGPVTWLLPKSAHTPNWVSGASNMVAIRVSSHPVVKAICNALDKPMVSTSANPAGKEPAKSINEVQQYFKHAIANKMLTLIEGNLGEQSSPSKIYHSLTMETIRS